MTGSGVVREWYESSTRVVREWCRSNTGVVREWWEIGARVVREWYESGTRVVREWYGSGTGVVREWHESDTRIVRVGFGRRLGCQYFGELGFWKHDFAQQGQHISDRLRGLRVEYAKGDNRERYESGRGAVRG